MVGSQFYVGDMGFLLFWDKREVEAMEVELSDFLIFYLSKNVSDDLIGIFARIWTFEQMRWGVFMESWGFKMTKYFIFSFSFGGGLGLRELS